MGCTIVTSREFNQDVSKVKIDAMKSPVVITDHGQAEHVLSSIKDYQKITSKYKTSRNYWRCLEPAALILKCHA